MEFRFGMSGMGFDCDKSGLLAASWTRLNDVLSLHVISFA
jgi:hypothetical protein